MCRYPKSHLEDLGCGGSAGERCWSPLNCLRAEAGQFARLQRAGCLQEVAKGRLGRDKPARSASVPGDAS